MKLRELESVLTAVAPFEAPNVQLEQYSTSAHLAAIMAHTIDAKYEGLEGRSVVDLGTGSGILGLACCVLGAASVLCVDIDADALKLARQNAERLGIAGDREDDESDDGHVLEFMRADILGADLPLRDNMADIVIMNPPFGTRVKGADVDFLRAAVRIARVAVYSLHKSSTRDFLIAKATREWGCRAEALAQLRFDLPRTYAFHKKQSTDIEVDLLRLDVSSKPRVLPLNGAAGTRR
ncbi:Methyltransferase-like protein 5 [Porphyridium purpureum]|uniref:Methyltransferase-like protein 5 n=1 Tax=Porphyridium purpureum TaxID=35688 RepID=A0A5J4YUT9_PORPP|nr:Methyltransferase-like protein 5 [Porphyridium purpureum]|eukprot:POR0670..scf227_4